MSELSNHLVEQILLEESNIKKVVVVYAGRFQPMHKGHFKTFEHLQKKFGKSDVFIGTSNKIQKGRSPFNFKEKVKIMTTMFGIPKSKIVQVKNPYVPTEILKKFNKKTTAFVTVVGQKDASRLDGKFFRKWDGNPTEGYEDAGYLYIAPMQGNSVSGTEVRNGLSMGSDDQKEKFFKDRAYGKFNKSIFKFVTDKLLEGLFVPKERIEEYIINEATFGSTTGADVDDGPNFFVPNHKLYKKLSVDRAAKLGWSVINMLSDESFEDYYEHPQYPKGPQTSVSYFPAGVIGAKTATNQVDIYSSNAYSKWFKHVTRTAALVGYEVVKGLDTDKDDKSQSSDDARGAKELEQEFEASLNESIVLPIKVGDVIMTGRFKNKKTVVKTIGKDEHGMPTINGRKVVTFRMVKEGFISELAGTEVKCEKCNHSWELEADDSEKYLCHSCGWDSQKNEYDFDAFDSWREKMGLSEDVEESKGRLRPAALLRRKAAMAGQKAAIARRRARTMKRKKPLAKLKKIAYKQAYLQVYKEFMQDLFPGMKRTDLSIQQAKIVHKNVLRKKGRVKKRAKFRFLPALRAKEAEKFGQKDETLAIGYPGKEDMKKINQRLDKQRSNTDSNKEYQYDTVNEGRPIPMDTPNEFVYLDFKKYAYKNRGMFKRELLKHKDNGGKMFLTLSALWYKWARKDNKEFTHIKDKLKFGRALMIMMVKDDLVFSKKAWKKTSKITNLKENINESKLLQEGGAYGHMSHPFDTDINLTFGQLKDIVNRALEGTLEFTREKTDGQALAVSWRDGRLVAARNKGHLKNKGENALDIRGVSDKFQGRGGLSDAYNFAMRDLSKAISSLSDKQRDKVFKEGACFMNLEVIYPTSVNVIPYGQALLVFHGTMEFNMEGVAIGENGDAARVLAGMIKQVNKDVQDNYTIQGPPIVKLPKSQDLSTKRSKYSSMISKLQKEFSLKDTDGVANYHQAWWEQWVDKNSPTSLDNKTKMGLVKRWAFMEKGFRLDKKNFSDEKTLEWAKKTDKEDQKKISKNNLMKFEQIFLGLGAEVLEFTSSALTVNADGAVRDMKKRIDKTIKDVKKSGDPKKIEKLKLELGRLKSIGGSKKIVPNEGIVFVYGGNTFKLTGTFASVNQILGIFF